MKDILQDIVAHTHALGFLSVIKVTNENGKTIVESMADDRSIILKAVMHQPVNEFKGVFGMPNLSMLALHLKNPEYAKDSKITIVEADRNGEKVPVHIHFQNQNGDFENTYRFMNKQMIEEKLKSVNFKGANWNIEIEPTDVGLSRMKLQNAAQPDEDHFSVSVDNNDLVFSFGDASTHAGKFVYHTGVTGKLTRTWAWPISQVIAILGLTGDKKMSISDQGALRITVDSGLGAYEYLLPAQAK